MQCISDLLILLVVLCRDRIETENWLMGEAVMWNQIFFPSPKPMTCLRTKTMKIISPKKMVAVAERDLPHH